MGRCGKNLKTLIFVLYFGNEKRSAWYSWDLSHEAGTPLLEFLSTHPFQQMEAVSTHTSLSSLERMTVIECDKSGLALGLY